LTVGGLQPPIRTFVAALMVNSTATDWFYRLVLTLEPLRA
jgi:hypothetical protein